MRLGYVFALLSVLGACHSQQANDKAPASQRPPQSGDQTELTVSNWQRLRIVWQLPPVTTATEALVGFDQIFNIVNKPEYGPCSSCHSYEWPYLAETADNAWSRFLESLNRPRNPVTSKEDLARLVIACVDPTSETHCAGDTTTSADNIDYKMPTRFGYDPVSAADLQILQQWLSQGVQEVSRPPSSSSSATIDQIRIKSVAPQSIEAVLIPDSVVISETTVALAMNARFKGPCVSGAVTLEGQQGESAISHTLGLVCDGESFQTEYVLQP